LSSSDVSGFTKELGSGVLFSGIAGKSGFTKELGSGVLFSGIAGKSGFTKELGLGLFSVGEDNITALAADVESPCGD
jgi:hypothetical protein